MEELIEQGLTIEESKIFPNLHHIQGIPIGAQQGADVFQILGTARVVHEPLKFESDQPFRVDDAQQTERGITLRGGRQQAPRNGAARVQQIDTLVASQMIGGIGASMQPLVPQFRQQQVHLIGILGIDQQVDVAGGPHDPMGRECQPADQSKLHASIVQRTNHFLNLPGES